MTCSASSVSVGYGLQRREQLMGAIASYLADGSLAEKHKLHAATRLLWWSRSVCHLV